MTDTQTIKDRLDIVQFIQEYVPLKKNGANWKANCPFHQEKSPSFMVHPEKQIWHCFGCGKGGDIFSFLQEIEGLEFSEALKLLANRAGVKLDTFVSEIKQSERNRIVEINQKAIYFFQKFLLEIPSSKIARKYLENRGLKPEIIREWGIGYSPDQWDLLTRYLLKAGYAIEDIIASGLVVKRERKDEKNSYYDRFRGRIMFPIYDVHGTPIGFTGRLIVEKTEAGGKYVNTPETLLYNKSNVLYGLHLAKKNIKINDKVLIVEGQMDVLSCYQVGMNYVVAASGTALTLDQIKLLKRYTNNIIIAFDADKAGEEAGKRGMQVALAQGMNIKIVKIPEGLGKDADECIKKDVKQWFEVVENAVEMMEWYFSTILKNVNQTDPKTKQQAMEVLLEQILLIPYALVQEHWVKRLSEALHVEISIVMNELKRIKKINSSLPSSREKKEKKIVEKKVFSSSVLISEQYEIHLQIFWGLLCKFPELYKDVQSFLKADYFQSTNFVTLYDFWQRYYNTPDFKLEKLDFTLGKENNELRSAIFVLKIDKEYPEITLEVARIELKKIWQRLYAEFIRKKRIEVEFLLKEAEKKQNKEQIQKLLEYLKAL